jgi:hypothetical protein
MKGVIGANGTKGNNPNGIIGNSDNDNSANGGWRHVAFFLKASIGVSNNCSIHGTLLGCDLTISWG